MTGPAFLSGVVALSKWSCFDVFSDWQGESGDRKIFGCSPVCTKHSVLRQTGYAVLLIFLELQLLNKSTRKVKRFSPKQQTRNISCQPSNGKGRADNELNMGDICRWRKERIAWSLYRCSCKLLWNKQYTGTFKWWKMFLFFFFWLFHWTFLCSCEGLINRSSMKRYFSSIISCIEYSAFPTVCFSKVARGKNSILDSSVV